MIQSNFFYFSSSAHTLYQLKENTKAKQLRIGYPCSPKQATRLNNRLKINTKIFPIKNPLINPNIMKYMKSEQN